MCFDWLLYCSFNFSRTLNKVVLGLHPETLPYLLELNVRACAVVMSCNGTET